MVAQHDDVIRHLHEELIPQRLALVAPELLVDEEPQVIRTAVRRSSIDARDLIAHLVLTGAADDLGTDAVIVAGEDSSMPPPDRADDAGNQGGGRASGRAAEDEVALCCHEAPMLCG